MPLECGDRIRLGSLQARILFTENQIGERVGRIGASLRERLGEECPVFVALLHGGFVFLSDLIRAYGAPEEVDFLQVSRYDQRQRDSDAVRVVHDLRSSIRDRRVVVVEGIRAGGTKIEYVDRFLRLHHPRSIDYCAMIRSGDANANVPLTEAGFTIGPEFVVGYGLDYRGQYRNLAFISALELPPHGGAAGAVEGVA